MFASLVNGETLRPDAGERTAAPEEDGETVVPFRRTRTSHRPTPGFPSAFCRQVSTESSSHSKS